MRILFGMTSESEFSLPSIRVAMTPLERFDEFLQARGKRITRQRRLIIQCVYARHDHFDAEQLLLELRAQVGSIQASRPTVYRTLNEMVDAGLLKKMVLDGRAVYEHDYGYPQHDHLYCSSCGKLIEFSSNEVGRIRDAVAREHQFRATGHRLIVTGTCSVCMSRRVQSRHQDRV